MFDKLASDIGPGRGRNTVLQDLLKGRASEVDMINGLVVEESRKRGRSAPANSRVAEIVRQIEAGALKPVPSQHRSSPRSFRWRNSLLKRPSDPLSSHSNRDQAANSGAFANGKTFTRRNVLALMASLVPTAAVGASYPDRPIKLIVALAAGGPADTAARVFAPYFADALGQSVVIENRTGASSVIGTEAVVRAAPDGYTLLFGSSSSFAVNPAVMKNLRFDVQKDLKLVGLVSYTPHVLVVRASLPVNTLGDLIALAKQRPGKLTYASSGSGGAIHLASELFKREARR